MDVEAIQIDRNDLVAKFINTSGSLYGFESKKIPVAIAILMTIRTDFCDGANAKALSEFALSDYGVSSQFKRLKLKFPTKHLILSARDRDVSSLLAQLQEIPKWS